MVYKYDKEADVLAVTLKNIPFDYAEEMGDFIVHFDKKNHPVYVEILNASRFLANASRILPKNLGKKIAQNILSS